MKSKPQPKLGPKCMGENVFRELLYEELRGINRSLRGIPIETIFGAIVEAHAPVFNERKLGELLGLSTLEAYELMRRDLPRFLKANPRLLGLLSECVGSDIPGCEGGGSEMTSTKAYVELSDTERSILFNRGWEGINRIFEKYRIEDVLVEVTGTPQNVALLHMLFRYFRRRIVVGSYVVRPIAREQPNLNRWISDICSYFGLDPLEFDRTTLGKDLIEKDPNLFPKALVDDISSKGRGGAVAVIRSNEAFGFQIDSKLFKKAEIEVFDPLEGWTNDGVFTYLKANELIQDDRLFEIALAGGSLEEFDPEIVEEVKEPEPVKDPVKEPAEIDSLKAEGGIDKEFESAPLDMTGWTIGAKDGKVRFKGTLKKKSEVPEAILFALENSSESQNEEDE